MSVASAFCPCALSFLVLFICAFPVSHSDQACHAFPNFIDIFTKLLALLIVLPEDFILLIHICLSLSF